ncbi:uncharacterized protein LOC114785771 [Denticeps clupeoides]|uniref:uncharacterized protein LOC114785771 n=1 Tax=Denticeps clupeoides TaxID=299321 RepID=UPI0010A4CC2F|nr:uncharacterized protein LOC114785771 [Denticeps clupeoides]
MTRKWARSAGFRAPQQRTLRSTKRKSPGAESASPHSNMQEIDDPSAGSIAAETRSPFLVPMNSLPDATDASSNELRSASKNPGSSHGQQLVTNTHDWAEEKERESVSEGTGRPPLPELYPESQALCSREEEPREEQPDLMESRKKARRRMGMCGLGERERKIRPGSDGTVMSCSSDSSFETAWNSTEQRDKAISAQILDPELAEVEQLEGVCSEHKNLEDQQVFPPTNTLVENSADVQKTPPETQTEPGSLATEITIKTKQFEDRDEAEKMTWGTTSEPDSDREARDPPQILEDDSTSPAEGRDPGVTTPEPEDFHPVSFTSISDSQLITVTELKEHRIPECPADLEDGTQLVCGLIRELSSLNRIVMAAHREVENIRRGSKATKTSGHRPCGPHHSCQY